MVFPEHTVTVLVVANFIPLVYTLLHMQVMAPTLLRNLLFRNSEEQRLTVCSGKTIQFHHLC